VIIPTHGRPEKLAQCVRALAAQTYPRSQYEVIVGFDGPDPTSQARAREAWELERGTAGGLSLVTCERQGLNATRNRLLHDARGSILVSTNDDTIADPTFLEEHARAHQDAASRFPNGVVVSGHSPFATWTNATLFDRLCSETSMIFFFDQMIGPAAREGADNPWLDWGFRHCWGLNFSAPIAPIRDTGGFVAFPLAYGYDDIEIAWRLHASRQMPVLFRPRARAIHDHRMTPREVLDREQRLGRSAWHFAGLRPDFCQAVFGRDLRSSPELSYSREFVARERALAERLEDSFMRTSETPANVIDALGTVLADRMVKITYEHHLTLKRWHWRRGFLDAAGA
jgi:glycosyltransferase involved in cell wall biosynthesis